MATVPDPEGIGPFNISRIFVFAWFRWPLPGPRLILDHREVFHVPQAPLSNDLVQYPCFGTEPGAMAPPPIRQISGMTDARILQVIPLLVKECFFSWLNAVNRGRLLLIATLFGVAASCFRQSSTPATCSNKFLQHNRKCRRKPSTVA